MYLCIMNTIRQIFNYSFKYKKLAFLTIIGNLLFTFFNLLSLVLFIPFLQLIFSSEKLKTVIPKPNYSGDISLLPEFIIKSYNFQMHDMVIHDPKQALFSVCIMVFSAFFLKNLFLIVLLKVKDSDCRCPLKTESDQKIQRILALKKVL